MFIPKPFLPVRVNTAGLEHIVGVIGREYVFGANGLLKSAASEGYDLLAAPVRIVSSEDGTPSEWQTDYNDNKSSAFIMSRADNEVIICGAMQSERFIINTATTIGYDGNISIDFKLMTRGDTPAEVFGTAERRKLQYKLDRLWLEIPLCSKLMTLFHMYPNSEIKIGDMQKPKTSTSMSGKLPDNLVALPFKPLLWLGNEDRGFGWYADNDKNWQPAEKDRAIELIRSGEDLILRIRLLDNHPESWKAAPSDGVYAYHPVEFSFGFQVTPVKPFPKQPYIHNALQFDHCKTPDGDYIEFLDSDGWFDRIAEKGVNTLILHEKWNKCQNNFELSEITKCQIRRITDECHKRGVKVLTYFGYELSSLSPIWNEYHNKITVKDSGGRLTGGWWRKPFQRDYIVCYNNFYADCFIEGILKTMDEFNTDGVYLDGSYHAWQCFSEEHGCGWLDRDGVLHGSYPITALRRMFRRLYEGVEARGGMINVHTSGLINFVSIPFIHQNWYGEDIQFDLIKGIGDGIDIDYFRAGYLGRNMGIPVEFIAYPNPPLWTFEEALGISLIHGILPRPNKVTHPLDVMSRIWKIFAGFPIAQSEWKPYWSNGAETGSDKVKVSYYKFKDLLGKSRLLIFSVNISKFPVNAVQLILNEEVSVFTDAETKEEIDRYFELDEFGYKIIYAE
ncbi:MAG: hypothetical protein ACOX4O_02060 [Eubacteriales bacterium]|jgi:hypothetical protein